MSSNDRYMSTKIRDEETDNVSMSIDTHDYVDDPNMEVIAVMLYTPWMKDTSEHYHIPFTKDQAAELHKWLGDFLNHPNIEDKLREDSGVG